MCFTRLIHNFSVFLFPDKTPAGNISVNARPAALCSPCRVEFNVTRHEMMVIV